MKASVVLRVLCLEDSPHDAELMQEMLNDAGFSVRLDRISTERDFLTLIKTNKYDVILADYSLPGFDARAALEWAGRLHPEVPFICVSGTIGEDTAVELLKQGASDYVLKDRMGRLGFSVRRALENAKEHEARWQAEEALRESRTIFRQLTENSQDVIYIIRTDGVITFASQGGLALQGYEPSDVVGRHYREFIHREDVELCRAVLEKVAATGERLAGLEYRVRHTDGGWHWYSTNLMPIKDDSGGVGSMIGNARDITDRKRMESRLALHAVRLAALLDLERMSDESDDRILDYTLELALKVAQSKYAWIGLMGDAQPSMSIPEWPREAVMEGAGSEMLRSIAFEAIRNGDVVRQGKPIIMSDCGDGGLGERNGSGVRSHIGPLLCVPVFDGERIAALAVVGGKENGYDEEDASELTTLTTKMWEVIRRRQDQQRINHLNHVLQAIRSVNQLIVKEKDPQRLVREACRFLVRTRGYDGAVIVATDAACRTIAFAEEGMPEAFRLVAEKLREGILPPCFDCTQTGNEVFLITERSGVCVSCPMCSEWPHSDTMTVRLVHDGSNYGFLAVSLPHGIGRDAEERSIFGELADDVAFALHNIELEEKARRAKERRRRAEAQLRQAQKMEALGTLAGGIAHDFNNILGIIVGYTEMVRWDMAENDPQYDQLQEVIKAANRAKELVKQILAFSRQSGQERKAVQIGLIVREVLKMLRASIPSTIEIRSEIISEANVVADPIQIHQLMMNLCTNAAHAMREHGGVLHVSTVDVRLGPEAVAPFPDLKPGPHVLLTIKDTGHGIDPAIMDRIFDPFFTTKEQGLGTGLGLAIVHGIVKSHGGAIDVESTPGRGTTFRVFFHEMVSDGELEKNQAEPIPRGNERILVVDDEPALASLMKAMLEHLGYDVVCGTNSMEAIETFRNQPPDKGFDMVITDMTMPHLTGADLATELRRLKPDLRIILCTGYHEMMDAEKAALLGFEGFLMKPVDIKSIAELVRKLADQKTGCDGA